MVSSIKGGSMGETVLYLGRVIAKEGFRAFIYGFENREKLVNSWEEFEKDIASGLWFSEKSKVPATNKTKQKGG